MSKVNPNQSIKYDLKNYKIPKPFIGYPQTIDDLCENLEDYNPKKKRKVLIVFDDVIADIANKANAKLIPIVSEL